MPRARRPGLLVPPLLAAALLTGACGGNGEPGGPSGGSSTLEATVTTDQRSYDAGAAVGMTLTVRNVSGTPVTLGFTSGQRYDFRIEDASGESVWTWSATMSFIQVLGEETIPAGGELSWSERADVDLEPGEYTVVGTVTNRSGGLGDRTTITVR